MRSSFEKPQTAGQPTKIVPRFFDEKSCLKLVYATMERASDKWRLVKMSEYDLALLRHIRKLYKWEENEDGFKSRCSPSD